MKLSVKDRKAALAATDLLIVLGMEREKVALPGRVKVPALALKAFKGENREARLTDATGGPAKRVLSIGLGKAKDVDHERLRRAAAIAVKKAEKVRAGSAVLWISPSVERAGGGAAAAGQALAEGAAMGAYALTTFKSDAKPAHLKRATLVGGGTSFHRGAKRGQALGEANLYARVLQDSPGNKMRPRDLAARARKLAAGSPRISARVLDEKRMQALGMGSLLSVSRGSSEPAYLIHLVYRPTRKARKRVCIVGKGLTFDAGGISLKPSAKMDEMKYDMSGGAAILGTFHALAALRPNVEVHGLVPTSENLPDGKANKPGDLVTAMNGKTIEVLNTDAEGRLILCDALAYAEKKIKPDAMVDLATLTGAVVVALGHELTGAMGNDEKLIDALVASGQATGEGVWPLPLLDAHKRQMKGKVGDLKNINAGQGAGASAGAAFLSHFVSEKTPWVHLDIAGAAWGAEDRDYQGGPQGTGVGVRLLAHWIESL
jgi:leucyl aminopeptidase